MGAGATDSDFTSSTVTDFTFTFDNGAPTIILSDLIIGNSPIAVTGVLVSGWSFRENPTTFTDADLTFAAASADYTNSILFPFESNGGSWVLRGTSGFSTLDHFLSYKVRRTKHTPKFEKQEVILTDQFESDVLFEVKKPKE